MMNEQNKSQLPTHNIKQLGFNGLRGFGSRSNFFQRWIGTEPENPTVSYCKTLAGILNRISISRLRTNRLIIK